MNYVIPIGRKILNSISIIQGTQWTEAENYCLKSMGRHLISFESEEVIEEMNDIGKGFVSSVQRIEAMQYWTGFEIYEQ